MSGLLFQCGRLLSLLRILLARRLRCAIPLSRRRLAHRLRRLLRRRLSLCRLLLLLLILLILRSDFWRSLSDSLKVRWLASVRLVRRCRWLRRLTEAPID